jgi:hypothetical protein
MLEGRTQFVASRNKIAQVALSVSIGPHAAFGSDRFRPETFGPIDFQALENSTLGGNAP